MCLHVHRVNNYWSRKTNSVSMLIRARRLIFPRGARLDQGSTMWLPFLSEGKGPAENPGEKLSLGSSWWDLNLWPLTPQSSALTTIGHQAPLLTYSHYAMCHVLLHADIKLNVSCTVKVVGNMSYTHIHQRGNCLQVPVWILSYYPAHLPWISSRITLLTALEVRQIIDIVAITKCPKSNLFLPSIT